MRRAVWLGLPWVAVLGTLAACGPADSASSAPSATTITHTITASPSLPAAASLAPPAKTADCPYISADDVANDNGQHVTTVKISAADDGQPHPVCYFYRPDGALQVTVRVYVGTPQEAVAIVNAAAPVSTSYPASEPTGWSGGLESGPFPGMNNPSNTVYAVSKGGDAVVVVSNQAQSIKARLITTTVIQNLGL